MCHNVQFFQPICNSPLKFLQSGDYSDILQDVNVPIVGNRECTCAYYGITENMICAGLRAGGKDACTVRQPTLFLYLLFHFRVG